MVEEDAIIAPAEAHTAVSSSSSSSFSPMMMRPVLVGCRRCCAHNHPPRLSLPSIRRRSFRDSLIGNSSPENFAFPRVVVQDLAHIIVVIIIIIIIIIIQLRHAIVAPPATFQFFQSVVIDWSLVSWPRLLPFPSPLFPRPSACSLRADVPELACCLARRRA